MKINRFVYDIVFCFQTNATIHVVHDALRSSDQVLVWWPTLVTDWNRKKWMWQYLVEKSIVYKQFLWPNGNGNDHFCLYIGILVHLYLKTILHDLLMFFLFCFEQYIYISLLIYSSNVTIDFIMPTFPSSTANEICFLPIQIKEMIQLSIHICLHLMSLIYLSVYGLELVSSQRYAVLCCQPAFNHTFILVSKKIAWMQFQVFQ